MLAKLPLDLSSFRKLRSQKYMYVDKTQYAYNLITGGYRFFLSRPRRFGKTLFVSTLKEILLGNKDLFEGLWISGSDYEWKKHAVITLDLSIWGIKNQETLAIGLKRALAEVARNYAVDFDTSLEPEALLRYLVQSLRSKFGMVALLIDEYDNPILHTLKDVENAYAVRDGIRSFFASIKGLEDELDFLFITGVSNFAKAGLFSGLNNLRVITLDGRFASICGYTENEITDYFGNNIRAWAKQKDIESSVLLSQIKQWYNGYHFSDNAEAVYNPFSLMHALEIQEFDNFWFQSGTPAFLIEELKREYRKSEYPLLYGDTFNVSKDTLGIFDVGAVPLSALMFQTGYLTIINYDRSNGIYKLGYPNHEVKTALQKHMLTALTNLDFGTTDEISTKLKSALNNGIIDEAVNLLKNLFYKVPYVLHIKKEKYYHALLQMAFDVASIKNQSEHLISHGRIDQILELPNWIYIIEIKFNKTADEALKQIETMKYHEPFLNQGKPVILLGLSFHREPKSFDITYKEKRLL